MKLHVLIDDDSSLLGCSKGSPWQLRHSLLPHTCQYNTYPLVSGMIICKQNVRGKEKGNIVGKQGKRVYVSMHPANLSESCSSQHWNYYNGLVLPCLNYIQPQVEFNLFIYAYILFLYHADFPGLGLGRDISSFDETAVPWYDWVAGILWQNDHKFCV